MAEQVNQPRAQQGATTRHNILAATQYLADKARQKKRLSERQRNAVTLLLRGMSDQVVAAEIGVDRGTIFRWRHLPGFQRELNRQRQSLWEASAGEIQSMVGPALTILRRQLESDDPGTALRAAGVLLRFATPSRLQPLKPREEAAGAKRSPMDRLVDEAIAYCESPLPGGPPTQFIRPPKG